MQRESPNHRPGNLKRKRRSSDEYSNDENEPLFEGKRAREDKPDDNSHSSSDERLPLSELNLPLNDRVDEILESSEDEFSPPGRSALGLSALSLSPSPDEDEPLLSNIPSPSKVEKLVTLKFANRTFLWDFFRRKRLSSEGIRRPDLFSNHPGLQPRMRSVLLEWIIEVCDVYKLHRETYYLAVDYLDRYLSVTTTISKGELQLIGVTCLLIAAKFEEIYPPKVSEFAYITDGACSEDDIIKMEVVMMKVLDWKCTVITCNSWVSAFLQLMYYKAYQDKMDVLTTRYSTNLFEKIIHLLDLLSLDPGFLRFNYKTLAVSALYSVCSKDLSLEVSGLKYTDIVECVSYMEPFWEAAVVKFGYSAANYSLETLPGPAPKLMDTSHTRIKHIITLDLLETAQTIQEMRDSDISSADILTPPSSSHKKRGPTVMGNTTDDLSIFPLDD